ncbi:unnamed protein product [Schistosoma curassoni]|uniref:RT_RNaseH_2 domain-containing protein n=1 Tax=Schistosoma curassoni TaxID=6186 RepID=A0A183KY84_9TREM|nr:unnamed protein product [Schistosoma curassoni]
MVRQNVQKVREFILELQKQAAKCNFGDQLHVQLRDRLIAGINIPGLERGLLRMPNCSLQDARTACINYEAVNELDIQSMKISNTLLSRHDEIQSQGQSNLRSFNTNSNSHVYMKGVSTTSYKANRKGEIKFGKCLSCGKFHSCNSCAFLNAKWFKCGKIGHIQSVYEATVHFASSSTKSCNFNLNNSDVSSDHLSLSIISKVDGNGFGPDMKLLAPLTNALSLKNLTELRSLVGALQYYSRFTPNFSCRSNCLFNILTSNSFKWSEEQESSLRSLLKFLQSDAVLRTYSPNVHSVLITDTSPVGIGAVLEQEGRPVICVSRKLTVTEQARSSAAMVQRWSIALSAYDYTVQHRGAKQIQHVDHISRQPLQDRPINTSDCL